MNTINCRIKLKSDTEENWESYNPTILTKELIGIEVTNKGIQLKVVKDGNEDKKYLDSEFLTSYFNGNVDILLGTLSNILEASEDDEDIKPFIDNEKVRLQGLYPNYEVLDSTDYEAYNRLLFEFINDTIKEKEGKSLINRDYVDNADIDIAQLSTDNSLDIIALGQDITNLVLADIEFKQRLTNNILTKDNTEEYVPTNEYNPATKKYADDAKADAMSYADALSGVSTEAFLMAQENKTAIESLSNKINDLQPNQGIIDYGLYILERNSHYVLEFSLYNDVYDLTIGIVSSESFSNGDECSIYIKPCDSNTLVLNEQTGTLYFGDDCDETGTFIPQPNTHYEICYKCVAINEDDTPYIVARVGSWT